MKVCLLVLDDLNQAKLDAAQMPRLQALIAQASKRFFRFVAAPNCSCFRAKVESGLYSHRALNRVGGIFTKDATASLPVGAHCLGNAGAVTSHTGKHHLCAFSHLEHRGWCGYTHYAGSQANLKAGEGTGYFQWETVEDGSWSITTEYATDYTRRKALERLAAGDDLVSVAWNVGHVPIHAPPGFTESSLNAMLAYADGPIADVIEAALAAGCLVIFTSDNGGTAGDGKGDLSAATLSTPLALLGDWPTTRACGDPVDTTDLHATIWQQVTGNIPDGCDGIPLTEPREVAFADKFKGVGSPPGSDWQECATDGVHKVIRRPSTGAYVASTWDDAPTQASVQHLLDALDAR